MGKLIKYDLRAALKLFLPFWLGTLLLSFVNSFMLDKMKTDIPALHFLENMGLTAYILAIVAIVIITVIYVIMRFYQSLLKREGYLTFTLPVTVDQILWSKALFSMLLVAGSAIVCVLSILIIFRNDMHLNAELIETAIRFLRIDGLLLDAVMVIVMTVLLFLAQCLSTLFQIYLSMGIGQLAQKRKLGASVLAYVVISIILSSAVFSVLIPFGIRFSEHVFPAVYTVDPQFRFIWILLGLLVLVNLFLVGIYYIPTRYLFKNRLNLE